MQQKALQVPAIAQRRAQPIASERGRRPRRRPVSPEVSIDHRDGPVDEVAKVVGQIGVVAPHEGIPADVAVAVEGGLAQRDVTRPVTAQGGDHVVGVEEVAAALAHPLALGEQPAVDPDQLWQGQSGAHEHGGPHDRVEAVDVLANDVDVTRPPLGERLRVVGEARAGDVVGQGVEPDVDRARRRIPRPVRKLGRRAILADRERDPP